MDVPQWRIILTLFHQEVSLVKPSLILWTQQSICLTRLPGSPIEFRKPKGVSPWNPPQLSSWWNEVKMKLHWVLGTSSTPRPQAHEDISLGPTGALGYAHKPWTCSLLYDVRLNKTTKGEHLDKSHVVGCTQCEISMLSMNPFQWE